MGLFDKVFLPNRKQNEFTLERYVHDLKKNVFRDKVCLGICESNGGEYLLKKFSIEPNALYVGSMGW
jgi:hypothetical protein